MTVDRMSTHGTCRWGFVSRGALTPTAPERGSCGRVYGLVLVCAGPAPPAFSRGVNSALARVSALQSGAVFATTDCGRGQKPRLQ